MDKYRNATPQIASASYQAPPQPCLQGIADILCAVSCLLCLQELLARVFIGLPALLRGQNDLFSVAYRPVG